MYEINLYISEVRQSVILPSGHTRHFLNWCNIYKGAKVVHRNWSNKHDNRSDTLPSIDTTTTRDLLASTMYQTVKMQSVKKLIESCDTLMSIFHQSMCCAHSVTCTICIAYFN